LDFGANSYPQALKALLVDWIQVQHFRIFETTDYRASSSQNRVTSGNSDGWRKSRGLANEITTFKSNSRKSINAVRHMPADQGVANLLSRLGKRFLVPGRWNVGFVREPISVFLESNAKHDIVWFPQTDGSKFLADPFGLSKEGKIHILCEEYDYYALKGRIVTIELTSDGFLTQPKVVFDFPFHASYPYVFESEGGTYCVPETAQAKEIVLFQSDEFPSTWKRVTTLVREFPGRDNTIFKHQGLWWLSSCAGDNSSLYLWYSDELLGRWNPHSANPVKVDINSSRPAGTPFVCEGDLYRPSQDCFRTYGARIVLNRVTRLTPSEFKEEPSQIVEPDPNGPYGNGVHTISSVGNITLIDGFRASLVRKLIKGS
jgi:hypothetical protein